MKLSGNFPAPGEMAAVVTRTDRGLGRVRPMAATAQGGALVVNGVDLACRISVGEELREVYGTALASGHGIADLSAAQALILARIDWFNSLDGLVANADLFHIEPAKQEHADQTCCVVEARSPDTLLRRGSNPPYADRCRGHRETFRLGSLVPYPACWPGSNPP